MNVAVNSIDNSFIDIAFNISHSCVDFSRVHDMRCHIYDIFCMQNLC